MWDPVWHLREVCPGHLLLLLISSSSQGAATTWGGPELPACLSHPTVDSSKSRAGGAALHEVLPQEGRDTFLNEQRPAEGAPSPTPSTAQVRPHLPCYLPREAVVIHPSACTPTFLPPGPAPDAGPHG